MPVHFGRHKLGQAHVAVVQRINQIHGYRDLDPVELGLQGVRTVGHPDVADF
jgi:hypothetical protein